MAAILGPLPLGWRYHGQKSNGIDHATAWITLAKLLANDRPIGSKRKQIFVAADKIEHFHLSCSV
jgi:hypothetical protein